MGGAEEDMQEEEEEEEEEEEGEEDEEQTCDFGLNGSSEDENRVMDWEAGLPSTDDLMPLSQPLIPPELASAFSIWPEPCRSAVDVNRASQNTLASIHHNQSTSFSSTACNLFLLPARSGGRDREFCQGHDGIKEREEIRRGGGRFDAKFE